jgi:hypothetical protein
MAKESRIFAGLLLTIIILSCQSEKKYGKGNEFEQDIEFLRQYSDVFVLKEPESGSQVAVIPDMQARVMTSSIGATGRSFGWINRQKIASEERQPHINVFGGEDRFWLGPEGGQFSIFFKQGDNFDLENWQTPEPIDWGAWELVKKEMTQAHFRKTFSLVNYGNFQFDILAERIIRVSGQEKAEKELGLKLDSDIQFVAYESDNKITNSSTHTWQKETGLLSIWILGMFKHSPSTTVVIPFNVGNEINLGPIVNDRYFGKVPEDRLKINQEKGVIFFKGDGQYRSKIGVSAKRAKNILGSYDGENKILTIVKFSITEDETDYVNSMWEIQQDPYGGDVVNSYNDGTPEPGKKPLGPFYELESSSRAADLAPREHLQHIHQTFHFVGPEHSINQIVERLFSISINEINSVF